VKRPRGGKTFQKKIRKGTERGRKGRSRTAKGTALCGVELRKEDRGGRGGARIRFPKMSIGEATLAAPMARGKWQRDKKNGGTLLFWEAGGATAWEGKDYVKVILVGRRSKRGKNPIFEVASSCHGRRGGSGTERTL